MSGQDVKRCWPDQFSSYELEGCQLSTGHYHGTLIRAPLRQRASDISHQIFGEEHLQKLRELIENEGQLGQVLFSRAFLSSVAFSLPCLRHMWLLFLRQISMLEVVDAETGQTLVSHQRQEESGCTRILSRTSSGEWTRTYSTAHDGDVSVALPREQDELQRAGRIFSRLPLDVSSGMPGHLSALFWTSTDRRTLVIDADKDQGHWANENRMLLSKACKCLVAVLAREAASSMSLPLAYFPLEDTLSPAGRLVRLNFYQEVAWRCNSNEAQVLYTIAGQPATGPLLLLSDIMEDLPQALKAMRAPVVRASQRVLQGLREVDEKLFQLLTPRSLRAWLRTLDPSLDSCCDPELLCFAVSDGDVDLEGCPLALTADGKVQRFRADGPVLVGCSSDDEWDLAQHFPPERVLRHVKMASHVVLRHPQVHKVDFDTVAEVGVHASGEAWATSFWAWFRAHCLRHPDRKLGAGPHICDDLRVLWHQEVDGSITLHPLKERHRAIACEDFSTPMVAALRACQVLLVQGCECAPLHDAKALTLAVHSGLSNHGLNGECEDEGWRQVLDAAYLKIIICHLMKLLLVRCQVLIRSKVPQARDIAQQLPLFWMPGLQFSHLWRAITINLWKT